MNDRRGTVSGAKPTDQVEPGAIARVLWVEAQVDDRSSEALLALKRRSLRSRDAEARASGHAARAQTGEFENAQFFIDVRYCSAPRLYLIFETAPAPFEKFWKPLQYEGALDLVPLVGTTTIVQTAFAHATYGPPLASYLRWTLNGTAGAWEVCFRITMSAS